MKTNRIYNGYTYKRYYARPENLTPAERIRYGKPLRASAGTRPLSIMHPRHPARTHGRDSVQYAERNKNRWE